MKKRYTILVTIFFGILAGILLVCLLIMPKKDIRLEEEKSDLYSIAYDSSWKKNEKKDNFISFEKDGNTLEFYVTDLDLKAQEYSIEYLLQNVQNYIKEEYPSYQLIAKEEENVTKNRYLGYTLLYEEEDTQMLITVAKKANQLLLINYTAKTDVFDILLDSAKNMIYQFSLLDPKLEIATKLDKIAVSKISYAESSYDYKENVSYELWSNHYHVKYQLPSMFKATNFSTVSQNYRYVGSRYIDTIDVVAMVQNSNLYELLKEDGVNSVVAITKELEENDKVSQLKIENDSMDHGYIYRFTYQYLIDDTKQEKERIYFYYALDELKTFVLSMEGTNLKVSKDLMKDIQVKEVSRYSSNIERVVSENTLKGSLRTFLSGSSSAYYNLKYQIKEDYVELDQNQNKETTRYFGYDYQDSLGDYNYLVELNLTSFGNVTSQIEVLKGTYAFYNNVRFTKGTTATYNGRKYTLVDVQYTINKQIKKDRYLLCDLSDGGAYIIRVTANHDIPLSILTDFTKVDITKQNVGP